MTENTVTDLKINRLLVNFIEKHPSLHFAEVYTEADELLWDGISKQTGIQKSWLKRRWHKIRYDYTSRDNTLMDNIDFLGKTAAKQSLPKLQTKVESPTIIITQSMLDSCDINKTITMETISIAGENKKIKSPQRSDGNESSENKKRKLPRKRNAVKPLAKNVQTEEQEVCESAKNQTTECKQIDDLITQTPNERSEEDIFGELVAAMLKKMPPDEKKRTKKEIMNILL